MAADEGTVYEVAQLVGRAVCETDLVSKTNPGVLSVVLLDADFDDSVHVVDRRCRASTADSPIPLRISVGAARHPTHDVDADSLKRQAAPRPVVNWRSGPSLPRAATGAIRACPLDVPFMERRPHQREHPSTWAHGTLCSADSTAIHNLDRSREPKAAYNDALKAKETDRSSGGVCNVRWCCVS
jgi:hypothetical protein